MALVSFFISGLLFGAGLIVSGLANPAKVQNFLDVAGTWDPSLALTMGAAVATTAIGYRFAWARKGPVFAERFQLPSRTDIDARLVAGAALFGIGWGLVGYCPGPALAALPIGGVATATFVAAMIGGMLVARFAATGTSTLPSRAAT
ncbi:MAG: DUF6691 family protein [Hyphomicrobium sp.]|nr:DUF6691 family protein [Hyphomicrobium sp.]